MHEIEPNRAGYFALTFAALVLCALGVLWVLASLPQSQPWVWAASPALLVYTALNWDLFGILPLAAGLWLWAKLKDHDLPAVGGGDGDRGGAGPGRGNH